MMQVLVLLLAIACTPAHADPITAIVLIAQGIAAAGGIAAIGLTAAMATYIAIGATIIGGVMARRKAARAAAAARNAARESLQERTMVLSSSEPSPQIIYGRATVGGAVIDRISSPKSILTDGGAVKLKPDALQHIVIALACHQITDVHRIHMFGEWHTWSAGTKEVGGTYTKTGASHVTASITASSTGTASIPGLPTWVTVSQVLSITQAGADGTVVAPAGWSNNGAAITGLPADSTWSVTYEATSNEPSLRVEWHPGTETQAASPYLLGVAPGRWTAAHQLKGIAYVVLTLDLDDSRFQNGLPQDLAFDVSGKPLLDPRTGVTVWSDNTALCIYDWLRSPWGYGLTTGDIDTASVVAAANACDTIVLHPTAASPGATGKFSVCGGSFKASDERSSVLGDLAENMGGFTVPGALWTMHAGTWSAPVMTIDDSHLGGPVQIVRSSTPHDEAFNSARATIIQQGKRDSQDVDPYSNSVFVADDGGLQWSTFTLSFCQRATQARNLLRQFVEQSRAGMVISLTGDMRLWPLQAGDRVAMSSSEYGWTGKTFRILDAAWAPGLPPSITAQEDIAASYDSADATDADPAPNTGLPDPGTVDTPVLQPAASGNAELIRHADGTILPRVLVTWQPTVTLYMQGPGARTDVSWRRITDDAWTDTRVPAGETQTYMSGMRDGDMLVITVRHVNSAGFASRWVAQSHRVVGKSAPPGNITALSVVDTPTGGRRYTVAHVQDLDHLGYEVRYSSNLSATFAQMTAIAARWDGAALVFDGGVPVDGVWRFAACAVDTSHNYSAAPIYVTATLAGIALATDPGISGGNQLFNSDFALGWRGWTSINGGFVGARSMNLLGWTIAALSKISGNTASISQGAPIGNLNAYCEEFGDPIPVTPLDFYCASAYTGAHRCRAAVFAYFFDASGATVGNNYGPAATCENNAEKNGGTELAGYKRIYGTGQAPATARTARLVLRKYDTAAGQPSSYLFACRTMFEQVASGASTPSSWSQGPSGYTGDLDATNGAPAGTLVGDREAEATILSIDNAAAAAAAASQAASTAQTAAKTATTQLAAIVDDGILSRDEKRAERIKWDALSGMSADTLAKANSYGIITERDTYITAINSLASYLTSLSPAWDDTTQNTPITATTYRSNWIAAYQAEGVLLNRIAEEAGKRATWAGTYGTGKPHDNATVGAAFGAGAAGNISGQIDPATLAQYVVTNTIHETASLALASALAQNVASPTVSANVAGGALVIVIGGLTVGNEPNSSNTATTGRLVLVMNGVVVGYSVQSMGKSGESGTSLFTAVTSWSGTLNGAVSAYIYAQKINGGQSVGIMAGTTVSIISLKG